jgi:hypothetical protein
MLIPERAPKRPVHRRAAITTVSQVTLRLEGSEPDPFKSVQTEVLGEQGDEYLTQHNGRKRELDRHLKKGNSRDARYCFRLYFFWDEDNEQVVVGWLTSHLGTRLT